MSRYNEELQAYVLLFNRVSYSNGFKSIEKITAPNIVSNILQYLRTLYIPGSLKPGETPSNSASHQAQNYVYNVLK